MEEAKAGTDAIMTEARIDAQPRKLVPPGNNLSLPDP
jgi:hypothetical protein